MPDLSPASLDIEVDRNRTTMRYVEIAKLYEAGVPIDDIKAEFGCSRGTVLRAARKAGLPKRSKRTIAEDIIYSALMDYALGVPLATISARYQVSQAVICKWRDEHRLPKRYSS